MKSRALWVDRLLKRLAESRENRPPMLPGLDSEIREMERDLANADVLLIPYEDAERFAESGEAPQDLKTDFQLPFDNTFIEFDPAVKIAGERGPGLRGILVTCSGDSHKVRAWFVERKFIESPRYDFTFTVDEPLREPHARIRSMLFWISGYISSPGLLAMRHNRQHDVVRRHLQQGLAAPTSYYTFVNVEAPATCAAQPSALVHGHFRRAHWHTLPTGKRVWYNTAWVRPYCRRIIASSEAEERRAA